jgi:PEP-CTERM motif
MPLTMSTLTMRTLATATATLLALHLGAAQAADLTIDATQAPGASFLEVQQFDPAQGWLQQVTLTLTGTITGTGRAEATGSGGTITLNWQTDLSVQLPGLDGAALLTVTPQMQRSFTATSYDGNRDYMGSSGISYTGLEATATATYSFDDGATLDLFRGTGHLDLATLSAKRNGMTGPANLRGGIASQASLLASVTYTYQPLIDETPLVQLTPVPEPGTWALMLAGMGLVGWLAARRRA